MVSRCTGGGGPRGICTTNDRPSRVASGLREENPSFAPRSAGAGGRSTSNERRLGGSVVGRDGECGNWARVVGVGFVVAFSGLLGGVLKGETPRSSEAARSCCGASELPSGNDRPAGLAGILGLPARFAGGGKDALFSFRSDRLSRETPNVPGAPGERCMAFCSDGTEDAKVGVVGRWEDGGGAGLGGSDSRDAFGGVREAQ